MRKLKRTTLIRILTLASFFIIVFFILNAVLNRIEERARMNTINTLQIVLNSSHTTIKDIWVEGHFIDATLWASNPDLVRNTKELLKKPPDPHLLLQSKEMTSIREFFKERLFQHNALGIFIISPDFVSLASMRDQNVGTINLMADQHKDRLEKVFKGHNQIIPPMRSDIPLPDKNGNQVDGYPTMFVLVPIKDTDGSIIAALSIRLNPFDDFNLLATATRIGFSGETYLIDKEGKLLTESRFLDHLYSIGILTNEKYSMLNIEIRDPGVNLLEGTKPSQSQKELPFTYAVQQLLKHKSGFSNIAYRDYRGVNVIGTWLWDDELDIGFITEIDEDEAMVAYRNTQLLTISLLLITVFLMLVLGFINWKSQQKNLRIIEQKESYFRNLLNNAISGIIIINNRGIIETFNKAAENIFGYTTEEIMGKNVSMLANEYDRKHHDTYIHNFIETRKPKIIGIGREVIGIRKDGSSFQMHLGVTEILVGDRIVFMGMVVDLTKEKEAEKALYVVEEKFKRTFDQAPISMIISDLENKFQKVNHAFCNLLGYSEKELLKMDFIDIMLPKDVEESKNKLKLVVEGAITKFSLEKQYIKKNKDLIWAKVMVSTLSDKSGEITNLLTIIEDISERKLLENELIKSKEKAESANKAKSTFLSNMSHEIRTPMNAILGFSEILSKRIKDQSHLDYLSSIQSSGKTLLKLINNILDLSKIESGKMDFSYDPTDIKQLIEDIIEMFREKCMEKNLQLNVIISKELPDVLYMDELRIKQMLINLINNSLKFTEKGYIEIEVSTQNIADNSLDLILKVKDSGIGIPKKYHKKIFKAFDQIETLDNKIYEGTGLGLTITQQLVKQMKGTITVKSSVGKGSIFTITLKKVKIDREEIQIGERIEFDPDLIQFEEATVLIVDDVKSNRNLLKGYMIDYNINCIEAENGEQAIIAIVKIKPDLVFLDLRMPIMDGYKTNEIIKKNQDWSHIPIIAITASAFDKDVKKVLAFGFNEYVSKPAGLTEILKILMKYLKHTIIDTKKEIITEVTDEPIDKLDEVLLEIDEKAMPTWKEIKVVRKKKNVHFLANVLIEIGEKYNAKPLVNYGNELLVASQSFNIVKEKKLIQQFPDFVNKLNCSNSGK